MNLGVTGSRAGHPAVAESLDAAHELYGVESLTLGDATGVDRQALEWAIAHGVFFVAFTANWEKLGYHAGPKRNAAMVAHVAALPNPAFLAFPIEGSMGTYDCYNKAKAAGIPTMMLDKPG